MSAARPCWPELGDIGLEIRRIGQGAEGRRASASSAPATYGMPTILKSFRASWPEVNLSLVPMNSIAQRSLIQARHRHRHRAPGAE